MINEEFKLKECGTFINSLNAYQRMLRPHHFLMGSIMGFVDLC